MNENAKEVFGIGKHDFWYYPGFAMAIGSFFTSKSIIVGALLAASTVFLVIFVVKSTPRYLKSRDLHVATRIIGLAGNVFLIVLQIAFVGSRIAQYNSDELNIMPIKKYIIPQNGMLPTLPAKATFWVKKRPFFNISNIRSGDIIVFHQEKNGRTYDLIWRVIGLPGDQVEIRGTDILINGNLFLHEKQEETSDQVVFKELNGDTEYLVVYDKVPKPASRVDMLLTVPKGTFFFLGDNRDNAYDSRFTGVVPFKYITGKKL